MFGLLDRDIVKTQGNGTSITLCYFFLKITSYRK